MTPTQNQKYKDGAEVRSMEMLNIRAKDIEENEAPEESYIVEGYAARYEPYALYKNDDGKEVYEQFSKENFEGANRSDIIFQYDHQGKVFARTGNGSLQVDVDDIGLHITADLGRTESARQMYEEIKAGMVTKMSWRFTVPRDGYQFDTKTRTITYKAIDRIYDVSAVSIPANDSTMISARAYADGLIAEEKARIEALERIESKKAEILEILGRIGGKAE